MDPNRICKPGPNPGERKKKIFMRCFLAEGLDASHGAFKFVLETFKFLPSKPRSVFNKNGFKGQKKLSFFSNTLKNVFFHQ
jgi:hypothetical protein